ncbi:MAG: helix-turn-helix transcriptional regulator [Chlamydiae bacterium]|nr:helix-turn-helix transcriptional regulator [Chlamydiota bacterium]
MKRPTTISDFGKRLTSLRKAKGLTQQVLGEKVGVSNRVIAYYEGETKFPPAHLLIPMAKALQVSADELLGLKQLKEQNNSQYASLWRKIKKIELLSKKDQKALLYYLDALLEKTPNPGHSLSFHEAARRKIKNI